MDTRGEDTPREKSTDLARGLIDEYTCPVTAEIMFEPVMISGCGHLVEGKMAGKLTQCPICREGEKGKGITVVAAPAIILSMQAKILAAYPTLWHKVNLDADYLAEVLRNNELKTPTGERFIHLLENNTEENLNEKALDGAQKGKSVIAILVSFSAGRELLRNNKKIQDLISEETKQLSVNGKTIDAWIKMEKEEPEASVPIASGARLFTSNNDPSSNVARVQQPQPADTVWQRVVYGNEAGVLQMLHDPRLVEQKSTVNDYSERVIDDATPFQMALRAGDDVMAEKIKDIYLAANPANGQAILDAQFNEVFPNGYAAHLQEQKDSANAFERDYINPLVEAMTNASPANLQAALDKRDDGSALCRALNTFRAAFTELSHREKVYNPNHLLKVFEKFNAIFDAWETNPTIHIDSSHVALFWRQVIGWEERSMTANYAQSFCTGLSEIVDCNQPLQRILNLRGFTNTSPDIPFFPLDTNPSSRLGADFAFTAAYNGGQNRRGAFGRRHGERFYRTYVEQKAANLGTLCSADRIIARRPGV